MSLQPLSQPFTLLVNSTDSYADCWEPFFTLMAAYWPDYQGSILLNSETAEYAYPGLDIRPSQSGQAAQGRRPTWSECLLHTLAQSPTRMVVYMQEDYFLKAPVRHQELADLARLMEAQEITYLGLTDAGNQGPFTPSGWDDRLWEVSRQDTYRISLQACMIDRERFARYLRRHENPWQFEYYGNVRARRRADAFFTLNRDLYQGPAEVLPYDPTGIVTKKWKQDVVEDLFARHNIEVDYTQRGWYVREQHPKPPRELTLEKLTSAIKSLI